MKPKKAAEPKAGKARPVGRPRKTTVEIEISVLAHDLAVKGCTNEEIAAVCNVSADTLERNFAGFLEKGRLEGCASLRRMQWVSAESGNVTAQIWLGKNRLGQSDKMEVADKTNSAKSHAETIKQRREEREKREVVMSDPTLDSSHTEAPN